jgi:hypothetical protein
MSDLQTKFQAEAAEFKALQKELQKVFVFAISFEDLFFNFGCASLSLANFITKFRPSLHLSACNRSAAKTRSFI